MGLKQRFSSHVPAAVAVEDGLDGREQRELAEALVGAGVGPVGQEAEGVAVLEPGGALLDSGLLQVGGKRGLAGVGG